MRKITSILFSLFIAASSFAQYKPPILIGPTDEVDPTVHEWAKAEEKPEYTYSEILGTPNLATVATSGSYNDLKDKPYIPETFDQVQANWKETNTTNVSYILNKPDLKKVATTGKYADLVDEPTKLSQFSNDIGLATQSWVEAQGYLKSYTESDPHVASWARDDSPEPVFNQVQSDWLAEETLPDSEDPNPAYIKNKPDLANIATTGSYNDLSDVPDFATMLDVTNIANAVVYLLATEGGLEIDGATYKLTIEQIIPGYSMFYFDNAEPQKIDIDGELDDRFSGNSHLVGAVIGTNITSLSHCAFCGTSITNMILPSSVTNIEMAAFEQCKSLTNIYIPDSVSFIGTEAFMECTNLQSAYIGANICDQNIFDYCKNLEDVEFGENVSSIGQGMFVYCSSLTNLIIPDSVTNIDWRAFGYCTSLTNVSIGTGIESIGQEAFIFCNNLQSVIIQKTEEEIISMDDFPWGITWSFPNNCIIYDINGNEINLKQMISTFYFTQDLVETANIIGQMDNRYENNRDLINVALATNVTSIADNAFNGCYFLSNIILPNTITNIGKSAFKNCELTSLVIPDSVLNIEDNAFNNANIGTITLGNGLTNISAYAFCDCYISTLVIPDNVLSIGHAAFAGAPISSLTIGSGVTNIDNWAFAMCAMTSVDIPDNVESIGIEAFGTCGNLTTVTIGSGINYISYDAFNECPNLTSITLDKTQSEIEALDYCNWTIPETCTVYDKNGTAMDCSSPEQKSTFYFDNSDPVEVEIVGEMDNRYSGNLHLTNVVLGTDVTSIGEEAFYCCSSIPSIVIPNSVTNIGLKAFYWCNGFTEITIPDSVTEIGRSVFQGCTNLENVVIGNGLTTISDYAFSGCSLTNIVFGTNITTIGNSAFQAVYIHDLTIPNSVTNIGACAFQYSHVINATIGTGVRSIDGYGFAYSSELETISIPSNVTQIGHYNFKDCNSLISITFGGRRKSDVKGMTNYNNWAIPTGVRIICTDETFEYPDTE